MIAKWKLILLNVICSLAKTQSLILKEIQYSPDYLYSAEQKGSLREKFIENKQQRIATAKRIEFIDKYLSDHSVFIDGILHENVDKIFKVVDKIEKAFRNLVGMDGVKYNFKRDTFWRTWRKVNFPSGERMVCYRCEGNFNSEDSENGGYWNIDEHFSCPFEIVSVIDNAKVCAIDFTNSTNVLDPCPLVVHFTDILKSCENPIETKWLIQKDFRMEVSKRYPGLFCEGRDFCNITTLYTITPSHVSFRIMNATNHVTYSKIMKTNNTNFACTSDCGIMDPKTKTISKSNKPFLVDLINNKNKREDIGDFIQTTDNKSVTKVPKASNTETVTVKNRDDKLKNLNYALNEMQSAFYLPVKEIERPEKHRHFHDTKHPTCSSMKHHMEDDASEDLNYFF